MNILVLTNEYPNNKYPKSDSPWTVPFFARAWVASGHNVVVVVNSTKFPPFYYSVGRLFKSYLQKKYDLMGNDILTRVWSRPFSFVDYGVKVFNLPMLKWRPSGRFAKSTIRKQLKRILKELNQNDFVPDVVTGHWANPQFVLSSKLKSFFPNAKCSIVFEGDFWPKYIKKYGLIKFKDCLDYIGCRSAYASSSLKQSLELPVDPFVCPSGIPNSCFDKEPLRNYSFNRKIRIISVGRLVGLKRIDLVLNALSSVDFDYEYWVLGEGKEKNKLIQLTRELKIDDNVSFFGKKDRNEVVGAMSRADVFVLISEREAFGLVYLEAMSQGCIVVATRNGGIDGIIVDGFNGFLCAQNDKEELRTILCKIKNMPEEEIKKISVNAISTAKHYTDDKAAHYYLKNIIGEDYELY